METGLLLSLLPFALVIGLAIGWFARNSALAALRRERDVLDGRFRQAIVELAGAEERARKLPQLEAQLGDLGERREAAERRVTMLETEQTERERAFEARLTELREAKEALSAQFSEVGGKILGEAQRQFLERAEQRFQQAGKEGEEKLKLLLQPVETTLKRYEDGLHKVEKERVESYAGLKQVVEQLTQGNDHVRRETARLANVMRSSPKARGRWGEEQLRNILESAGLAENVDFSLQTSVADGERQLRPDCVINLPGGRCIVVDVKCPLVAFEQAYDEEDEGRRAALLLQHANAMKSYAADLGRKGYWRQFDLSPDFVIMYIPGEHFLSAASERAPDLIDSAYRNGVIVASTINMLALAKVMAGMWRQEKLAEEAQKIGALGKELYARLATMGGHVAKLGRNLNQATGAYNDFVGSLESQVMTQAKRFEALNVETGGKAIDLLPVVDTAIRPLTKLAIGDMGAEVVD